MTEGSAGMPDPAFLDTAKEGRLRGKTLGIPSLLPYATAESNGQDK